MKRPGKNTREEYAAVQAVSNTGTVGFNSTNTSTENNFNGTEDSNNEIYSMEDMSEQYRIMAQIEANIRVKDNTGFDMVEYKQELRLLEEGRRQQEQEGRYQTKPRPMLPDVQQYNSSPSKGAPRAEEPPLPFTRANRRYVLNGRSNNNRVRVPEICPGVVVPKNVHSTNTMLTNKEQIVKCWGCSSVSEVHLRVNALASLVQCPECLTISPIT